MILFQCWEFFSLLFLVDALKISKNPVWTGSLCGGIPLPSCLTWMPLISAFQSPSSLTLHRVRLLFPSKFVLPQWHASWLCSPCLSWASLRSLDGTGKKDGKSSVQFVGCSVFDLCWFCISCLLHSNCFSSSTGVKIKMESLQKWSSPTMVHFWNL